jgi:hypothetical protein
LGELATFDGGEVFADGVHLMDVGAGGQELAGDGLFFGEGDAGGGQRHERGGAAGDAADDEVFGGGFAGEFGDALSGGDAAFVGDGVAAFAEFGVAEGGGVAVLDDDAAGGDAAAADLFDGLGHGGGGLAGAEEEDAFGAAEERFVRREVSENGGLGIGGFEGGVEDLPGLGSFRHRRGRMAATASAGSSEVMGMVWSAWA